MTVVVKKRRRKKKHKGTMCCMCGQRVIKFLRFVEEFDLDETPSDHGYRVCVTVNRDTRPDVYGSGPICANCWRALREFSRGHQPSHGWWADRSIAGVEWGEFEESPTGLGAYPTDVIVDVVEEDVCLEM